MQSTSGYRRNRQKTEPHNTTPCQRESMKATTFVFEEVHMKCFSRAQTITLKSNDIFDTALSRCRPDGMEWVDPTAAK